MAWFIVIEYTAGTKTDKCRWWWWWTRRWRKMDMCRRTCWTNWKTLSIIYLFLLYSLEKDMYVLCCCVVCVYVCVCDAWQPKHTFKIEFPIRLFIRFSLFLSSVYCSTFFCYKHITFSLFLFFFFYRSESNTRHHRPLYTSWFAAGVSA